MKLVLLLERENTMFNCLQKLHFANEIAKKRYAIDVDGRELYSVQKLAATFNPHWKAEAAQEWREAEIMARDAMINVAVNPEMWPGYGMR